LLDNSRRLAVGSLRRTISFAIAIVPMAMTSYGYLVAEFEKGNEVCIRDGAGTMTSLKLLI
jgi:hypothetical protein